MRSVACSDRAGSHREATGHHARVPQGDGIGGGEFSREPRQSERPRRKGAGKDTVGGESGDGDSASSLVQESATAHKPSYEDILPRVRRSRPRTVWAQGARKPWSRAVDPVRRRVTLAANDFQQKYGRGLQLKAHFTQSKVRREA